MIKLRHLAFYEIKTLCRSKILGITVGLSISGIFIFHLITQSTLGNPPWNAISLPSSIPYTHVWLTGYLQMIITLFWAGRFILQDRQADSNASIQVRPYTNGEYVWGKQAYFFSNVCPTGDLNNVPSFFRYIFSVNSSITPVDFRESTCFLKRCSIVGLPLPETDVNFLTY